ncbi:MAG: tetratricopeptide repeat protein, partial [Bdellovibrionota bacterium]
MRTVFTWWIAIFICFSFAALASAQDSPLFQTLDQYTRIQIPVTGGSSFRLLNGNPAETKLIVDRMKPEALESLKNVNDRRVKSVTVSPTGLDKAEITVRFQESGTEAFAYMQGANLVLDLWRQEGKAQAQASVKPAAKLPAEVKKVKPASRSLASVKKSEKTKATQKSGKTEPAVSAVAPLDREKDLFQKFPLPMPELKITAKDGGIDLPPAIVPEKKWKFTKGDKTTEEGRVFELAKSLFAQGKYGLTTKTIEIALRDFPESEHNEELNLLQAFTYRKMAESTATPSLSDRAETMFTEMAAQRDGDGNPLAFNRMLQLYFGQKEYAKENWLQAIQHFEAVATATPEKDADYPYVQMLLADCYTKVEQGRRAERIFRFLAEHYPNHVLGKEGRYRIADLLGLEKNYTRVIEEGQKAMSEHPEYEKTRFEVSFQVGEAAFSLGQFALAEKYFRRFTELNSAATTAGLAWVRLGEIAELSRKDLTEARKSYMHAKNGYPFSQADLVATVRLARIDLPTEPDPAYVVKVLNELLPSKSVDADLRNMAKITLGQYLLRLGQLDEAISLAQNGMAQAEGAAYEGYKLAYMQALVAKMNSYNQKNRFADALALYNRERKWFDLYGAESYRSVSDTYRGLGLYATSNDLMEKFRVESAKSRGLASLASDPSLEIAKAKNSFARGAYSDAIAQVYGKNDLDSTVIRSLSEFRLGHKKDAYASAEKAFELMKPDSRANDLNLIQLNEVVLDRDQAERDFKRMERDISRSEALLGKDADELAYGKADALWYQKRH